MLAHLVDVSLRSFLLAVPAAVVLWTLRSRQTAALQHAVWASVVCGMLALFLFGQALPRVPLRIMDRPAVMEAAPQAVLFDPPPADRDTLAAVPAPATMVRAIGWKDAALYAYGAISFGFLVQFVTALFLVRKLHSTGRPIPNAGPDMYESEVIGVPVTVGWLRPRILLPPEWCKWDREKLDAVLAHEGAHARRRDGLVAALAGLNRCIFWFHPLAWLLQSKLALLAEQACDESCVAALGDRQRYANLLLEMAGAVDGSLGRLRRHALTMAAVSHIRQRIDALLQEGRTFSRGLTWTGWAAVMLCGMPVVLCAGAVELDRLPPVLRLDMPRWATPAAPSSEVLLAQVRPIPPVQLAQAAPPQSSALTPKFDSASIKPCAPGDGAGRSGRGGGSGRGIPISPPGEFFVNCLSVWELINHYIVFGNEPLLNNTGGLPAERERVRGGPEWLSSDYYTIHAKTGNPSANELTAGRFQANRMMSGPMLRALLEDRFQLRTHRETEEIPMYALVVAEGGFKLQPMEEGGCIVTDPNKGVRVSEMFPPGEKPLCTMHLGFHGPNWMLRAAGRTLSDMAGMLGGGVVDRPVMDKTGITGAFSFQLEFARDQDAPGRFPPGFIPPVDTTVLLGPVIGVAIEQLGLGLVPDKGPREYIVIDGAQRPSFN